MKLKSEIKRKKNMAIIDKLQLYQKQAKNKPAVKVGYPFGKEGSIKYPKTGTPVASVAFWNEFGTHNPDGSIHTPARPFFRTAISENKKKYKKILQKRQLKAKRESIIHWLILVF
jgi:HK97 gp10 family phage protein